MHNLHTFKHRLSRLYTWPQQAKKGKNSNKYSANAPYLFVCSLLAPSTHPTDIHEISTSLSFLVELFSPNDDLARTLAKGFPVVSAINGFDGETRGQEKQLEFTWEEDVRIESGQVAFIFARLKELFMRQDDMLQLFKRVIFPA